MDGIARYDRSATCCRDARVAGRIAHQRGRARTPMSQFNTLARALIVLMLIGCISTSSAHAAGAIRVQVIRATDSWQLLRDGKPYFIKGGGGGASKELLARLGGNSFRTWGVGDDTMRQLDEAQKLGLTVTLGIWLRHESD